MTARKLLWKECKTYIAYVMDSKRDNTNLSNIPIIKEFPYVFAKELLGLPSMREIKVFIDVLPRVSLITQSPYTMKPMELAELKVQL